MLPLFASPGRKGASHCCTYALQAKRHQINLFNLPYRRCCYLWIGLFSHCRSLNIQQPSSSPTSSAQSRLGSVYHHNLFTFFSTDLISHRNHIYHALNQINPRYTINILNRHHHPRHLFHNTSTLQII